MSNLVIMQGFIRICCKLVKIRDLKFQTFGKKCLQGSSFVVKMATFRSHIFMSLQRIHVNKIRHDKSSGGAYFFWNEQNKSEKRDIGKRVHCKQSGIIDSVQMQSSGTCLCCFMAAMLVPIGMAPTRRPNL